MKKLLIAAFLIVMLSIPAQAIELITRGHYICSNEDTHFIVIQGELYTIDKRLEETIKQGTSVILKFVLNDDDRVVEIKIIDAKWGAK